MVEIATGTWLRVISVILVLKDKKPLLKGYPVECHTIGDHIRKVRMDRKLSQGKLSRALNVSVATIANWELNRSKPLEINLSSIIDFLGYVPTQVESKVK
tara:strand:+ start:271 stop:570 length:300 start_codon:yes stop_codon:yes gene_type:complete